MSWIDRLNPFSKGEKSTTHEIVEDLEALSGIVLGDTAAGISVTPGRVMRHSTVYSCVRVLAESVGQLPLKVYQQEGESRVRKASHPLQNLLNDPNDYQTGQEFWEQCITALCLRGNFYAYIVRINGRPAELLPLQPGTCKPKLRENYTVVYEVTFLDGRMDVLDSSQILHIKGIATDGILGLSPIAHARETIALAMAAEKYGSKLFKNGARPGGVLTTDQILKDETYDRLKANWAKHHKGTDNAHETAILEAGLTYKSIAMSNDDAQFLETRKLQRNDICGIFRVPPHKIGDLERSTFSNIEHQAQEFVTDALMPYLVRIENRTRRSLVGRESKVFAKFQVNSLLRGDMKARGEFYTRMVQNGAYSPNEIRAFEDMNPRDGGDIYLTPVNMLIDGKLPNATEKTE